MVPLDKTSDNNLSEDSAVNSNLDTDSITTENLEPKSAKVNVSSRTSSSVTPTPPGAWKTSFDTKSDSSSLTTSDPAKPTSASEAEDASANSISNENTQPQTTTETDIAAETSEMDGNSSPPTLPLLSKITYGFGLDVVDPEPVATTTTAKLGEGTLSSPTVQQTQLPESLQDRNSDAKASTMAENNDLAWPNLQSSVERKHSSQSLATPEPETIATNAAAVVSKMENIGLTFTAVDTALHRRALNESSNGNSIPFKPNNNTKPLPERPLPEKPLPEEPSPSSSPAPQTTSPPTPSYPKPQAPNVIPTQGPSAFATDSKNPKPPRKHEGPKWLEDMLAAKNTRQAAEASNSLPTLPRRVSLPWRRSFSLQKSSTSNALSPNNPATSKSGDKGTSWDDVDLTEAPRASPSGVTFASPNPVDHHHHHHTLNHAATLSDLHALDAKIPWETPPAPAPASKSTKARLRAALGKGKEIAGLVGRQMKKGEFPWTQWYCCGQVNGVECETVNSRFRGRGRCKRCGHAVCGNCVKVALGG